MISPRERPIFYNDLKSLSPPRQRRYSHLPRLGAAIGIGITAFFLLGNVDRKPPVTEPAPEVVVQPLETGQLSVATAGIPTPSAAQGGVSEPAPGKSRAAGWEADYMTGIEPASTTAATEDLDPGLDLQPRLELPRPKAPIKVARLHAGAHPPETAAEPQWEHYTIRKGDTLGSIFARAGLPPGEAAAVSRAARKYRFDRKLRVGRSIFLLKNPAGGLARIEYDLDARGQLSIARSAKGFRAEYLKHEVEVMERTVGGTIRRSFSASARKSGLPASLVRKVTSIFRDQINLGRKLRAGDSFVVIYREEYVKGRKIKDGPILAAEINHRGKRYQAIRYRDRRGQVSYYTPEGKNLMRGFIRRPLRGGRITSRYGMRRHPIRGRWQKHTGVDYAAKLRTPVMATGDGVVRFARRKGGYGKTILIEHSRKYRTLYAHLAGYRKGLRAGTRVRKGEVIGYVGNTGISTGPHLHYEFQVNGKPKDPLKVKLPESLPIPPDHRRDFLAKARSMERRLAAAEADNTIRLARNGPGRKHPASL